MNCGSCKYWDFFEEGQLGSCHRHAPSARQYINSKDANQLAPIEFPVTRDSDWCGDYIAAYRDPDLPWSDFVASLSRRVRNVFRRMNLNSYEELLSKDTIDLLYQKCFGNTSLREVRRKLAQLNLHLKDDAAWFSKWKDKF